MARAVDETAELVRYRDGFAGLWFERLVPPDAALAHVGRVARARVGAQDLLERENLILKF